MSVEPSEVNDSGLIEPPGVAAHVEQLRITALRRGYRVASMVGAFQLAGYLMVMSVFPQDHTLLGHRWSHALMVMAAMVYGVLAMRPSGWISTVRQATAESVLVVASSFVLAAMHARHGAPGHVHTHVSLAPVAMLYSLLFPLPFRWSVLALFSITGAYPLTQVLLYGMSVVDVNLGLLLLNCAAVLSLALIVSFVHNRIFASNARARALLDLDHFKLINDQLGHRAGDRALNETAEALRVASSRHVMLARVGGEEFAVLLRASGEEDAQVQTTLLLEAVSSVRVRDSGQLLSASAGVARMRSGDTFQTLLAAADAALRVAKASGRRRAILYDAESTEQMLHEA